MKESPLYDLNKKRTEMGNSHVTPKFSGIICAISTLGRYCYTKGWTKDQFEKGIKPATALESEKVI